MLAQSLPNILCVFKDLEEVKRDENFDIFFSNESIYIDEKNIRYYKSKDNKIICIEDEDTMLIFNKKTFKPVISETKDYVFGDLYKIRKSLGIIYFRLHRLFDDAINEIYFLV